MGVHRTLLLPFTDGMGFECTEGGDVKRLTSGSGSCRHFFNMNVILSTIRLDRIVVMSLEFIQEEEAHVTIGIWMNDVGDVIKDDIAIGPP